MTSLHTTASSGPKYRLSLRDRVRRLEENTVSALRRRWDHQMAEPKRKRRTIWGVRIGGAALVLSLAGVGWWIWGPRMQPNYDTAGIDALFDYTLLTNEFNNLPVEERLALLGKLVKRLKSMDGEDSMLLAAFASGIAGSARKQLEENASRLAIDLWDKHAKEYEKVPKEEREDYLEAAFIDFTKTMEEIAGEQRDKSDSERINEARAQAKRDSEMIKKNPDRMPDGKTLGRIASFMNNNVGSHATPQQRQRGQQMIRDMTRHFRNEDLTTGKPKGPP